MTLPNQLTFAWWNLHNFAHFDAAKSALPRWPQRQLDYEAKRDRILATLNGLPEGVPDLIAVCEITREAAQDLATAFPPGFAVAVAPTIPHEDAFQVFVIYRSGIGFKPELPLIPAETEDVASETRPMIAVHFSLAGHLIRFIACHWTGFDKPSSFIARKRLADFLRHDIYQFLHPEVPDPQVERHIVILGDLNEEPMSDIFVHHLDAGRDRYSSRKPHYRDKQVRRVRLYNLAWRHLGEQIPHGASQSTAVGSAGTWYNAKHGWKTIDHVLTSGGLLGSAPPLLDEANTRVHVDPVLLDDRSLPRPFEPDRGYGVSDHLPIVGRLSLPGTVA